MGPAVPDCRTSKREVTARETPHLAANRKREYPAHLDTVITSYLYARAVPLYGVSSSFRPPRRAHGPTTKCVPRCSPRRRPRRRVPAARRYAVHARPRADQPRRSFATTCAAANTPKLFPAEGGWHVRDLGSLNGTHLNGDPVRADRPLHPLDELRTGRTRLVFVDALGQLPGLPNRDPPRTAGGERATGWKSATASARPATSIRLPAAVTTDARFKLKCAIAPPQAVRSAVPPGARHGRRRRHERVMSRSRLTLRSSPRRPKWRPFSR